VDGGQILSNEVLIALESAQLYSMQDVCYLSLHAMYGHPQGKAIQLRALVQNQVMVILVDSDSSHTFLNVALVHKLKVSATLVPQMTVKVSNGQSLSCTTEVKQFAWWIQSHTFQVDAKVIEMGTYDLVLDMDWLKLYRSMMCDWLEKWIEFQYQGITVRLHGMVPSQPQELLEISMEQVLKLEKGNDLVAVLLEPESKSTTPLDNYLINGVPP
jgi:hypothetical protein